LVLSTETLEDYFDISTEAWSSGPYAITITDGDKILGTEGVLIVQGASNNYHFFELKSHKRLVINLNILRQIGY